MKYDKFCFLLLMLTYITSIHAQKKVQGLSEYTASNEITYKVGDRIKMKHGAGANGDFKSLIVGVGASSTNQLGAVHSNFIFTIKKIRSWNLSYYKGVTFVLGGGGMPKNSIDIELAIQNCEIVNCIGDTKIIELDHNYKEKKDYEEISEFTASNGITYKIGDTIKLNKGSARSGNFVFLRDVQNGVMSFNKNYQSKAKRAGETVIIDKIKKYNLEYLDGVYFSVKVKGRLRNSVLDIENAIYSCEIGDCEPSTQITNSIKEVETSTSTQAIDKYDKLRKIKKLYDEGVLTEQEFLEEKKKILNH